MSHEKLHQRKIMSVTNLTQNILKRLWNVRKTSDKKACLYFRLFLTKYILQIYQTRIILSLTLYYLTPLWFSSPTSVGTTIFIDMDVDINQLIIYMCFKSSISLKWKTILRYIYFIDMVSIYTYSLVVGDLYFYHLCIFATNKDKIRV